MTPQDPAADTGAPGTEAGRVLLHHTAHHNIDCRVLDRVPRPCNCGLRDRILAIEAEATATERQRAEPHVISLANRIVELTAALAASQPSAAAAQPIPPAWLIYYDDPSQSPELFAGHGAEVAARARSEYVGRAWNHYLFAAVEWPRDTEVESAAAAQGPGIALENVRDAASAVQGYLLDHPSAVAAFQRLSDAIAEATR